MALVILLRNVSSWGGNMELLSKNCGCQFWPLWRLPERLVQELVFVLTSLECFHCWAVLKNGIYWRNLKAQELTRKAWNNRQYLGPEADKWRSTERRRMWKEICRGRRNFKKFLHVLEKLETCRPVQGYTAIQRRPETLHTPVSLGSLQAGSEG